MRYSKKNLSNTPNLCRGCSYNLGIYQVFLLLLMACKLDRFISQNKQPTTLNWTCYLWTISHHLFTKTSFLADNTCTWTIFPERISKSKNTATVCQTIHAWNAFDLAFRPYSFGLPSVWFNLDGLNQIMYREHFTSLEGASFFGYFFFRPFVPWVMRVMPVSIYSALHAWLVFEIAKKHLWRDWSLKRRRRTTFWKKKK